MKLSSSSCYVNLRGFGWFWSEKIPQWRKADGEGWDLAAARGHIAAMMMIMTEVSK